MIIQNESYQQMIARWKKQNQQKYQRAQQNDQEIQPNIIQGQDFKKQHLLKIFALRPHLDINTNRPPNIVKKLTNYISQVLGADQSKGIDIKQLQQSLRSQIYQRTFFGNNKTSLKFQVNILVSILSCQLYVIQQCYQIQRQKWNWLYKTQSLIINYQIQIKAQKQIELLKQLANHFIIDWQKCYLQVKQQQKRRKIIKNINIILKNLTKYNQKQPAYSLGTQTPLKDVYSNFIHYQKIDKNFENLTKQQIQKITQNILETEGSVLVFIQTLYKIINTLGSSNAMASVISSMKIADKMLDQITILINYSSKWNQYLSFKTVAKKFSQFNVSNTYLKRSWRYSLSLIFLFGIGLKILINILKVANKAVPKINDKIRNGRIVFNTRTGKVWIQKTSVIVPAVRREGTNMEISKERLPQMMKSYQFFGQRSGGSQQVQIGSQMAEQINEIGKQYWANNTYYKSISQQLSLGIITSATTQGLLISLWDQIYNKNKLIMSWPFTTALVVQQPMAQNKLTMDSYKELLFNSHFLFLKQQIIRMQSWDKCGKLKQCVERGDNELANQLIKQFYKKGSSIKKGIQVIEQVNTEIKNSLIKQEIKKAQQNLSVNQVKQTSQISMEQQPPDEQPRRLRIFLEVKPIIQDSIETIKKQNPQQIKQNSLAIINVIQKQINTNSQQNNNSFQNHLNIVDKSISKAINSQSGVTLAVNTVLKKSPQQTKRTIGKTLEDSISQVTAQDPQIRIYQDCLQQPNFDNFVSTEIMLQLHNQTIQSIKTLTTQLNSIGVKVDNIEKIIMKLQKNFKQQLQKSIVKKQPIQYTTFRQQAVTLFNQYSGQIREFLKKSSAVNLNQVVQIVLKTIQKQAISKTQKNDYQLQKVLKQVQQTAGKIGQSYKSQINVIKQLNQKIGVDMRDFFTTNSQQMEKLNNNIIGRKEIVIQIINNLGQQYNKYHKQNVKKQQQQLTKFLGSLIQQQYKKANLSNNTQRIRQLDDFSASVKLALQRQFFQLQNLIKIFQGRTQYGLDMINYNVQAGFHQLQNTLVVTNQITKRGYENEIQNLSQLFKQNMNQLNQILNEKSQKQQMLYNQQAINFQYQQIFKQIMIQLQTQNPLPRIRLLKQQINKLVQIKDTTLQILNVQQSQLITSLRALKSTYDQSVQFSRSYTTQAQTLRSQKSRLQRELNQSKILTESFNEKIKQYSSIIEQKQQKIQKIKTQFGKQRDSALKFIAMLQGDLKKKEYELEQQVQKVKNIKKKIQQQANTSLEISQQNLKKMNIKLKISQQNKQQLEKNIEQLKKQIKNVKKIAQSEKQSMQNLKQKLQKENRQLSKNLQIQKKQKSNLSNILQSQKKQKSNLNTSLQVQKKKNKQLQNAKQTLKKQLNQKKDQLSSKITANEIQINKIRRLDQTQQKIRQIKKLQQQNQKLRLQKSRKQNEHKSRIKQLQQKLADISKISESQKKNYDIILNQLQESKRKLNQSKSNPKRINTILKWQKQAQNMQQNHKFLKQIIVQFELGASNTTLNQIEAAIQYVKKQTKNRLQLWKVQRNSGIKLKSGAPIQKSDLLKYLEEEKLKAKVESKKIIQEAKEKMKQSSQIIKQWRQLSMSTIMYNQSNLIDQSVSYSIDMHNMRDKIKQMLQSNKNLQISMSTLKSQISKKQKEILKVQQNKKKKDQQINQLKAQIEQKDTVIKQKSRLLDLTTSKYIDYEKKRKHLSQATEKLHRSKDQNQKKQLKKLIAVLKEQLKVVQVFQIKIINTMKAFIKKMKTQKKLSWDQTYALQVKVLAQCQYQKLLQDGRKLQELIMKNNKNNQLALAAPPPPPPPPPPSNPANSLDNQQRKSKKNKKKQEQQQRILEQEIIQQIFQQSQLKNPEIITLVKKIQAQIKKKKKKSIIKKQKSLLKLKNGGNGDGGGDGDDSGNDGEIEDQDKKSKKQQKSIRDLLKQTQQSRQLLHDRIWKLQKKLDQQKNEKKINIDILQNEITISKKMYLGQMSLLLDIIKSILQTFSIIHTSLVKQIEKWNNTAKDANVSQHNKKICQGIAKYLNLIDNYFENLSNGILGKLGLSFTGHYSSYYQTAIKDFMTNFEIKLKNQLIQSQNTLKKEHIKQLNLRNNPIPITRPNSLPPKPPSKKSQSQQHIEQRQNNNSLQQTLYVDVINDSSHSNITMEISKSANQVNINDTLNISSIQNQNDLTPVENLFQTKYYSEADNRFHYTAVATKVQSQPPLQSTLLALLESTHTETEKKQIPSFKKKKSQSQRGNTPQKRITLNQTK